MVAAEADNRRRIERVKTVCRSYGIGPESNNVQRSNIKHPPTPQYGVFYIDQADSLAYCPIYKAASTTWLYNMCLLSGLSETELDEKIKRQQLSTTAREIYPEMDFQQAKEAVEKLTKLVVVRHPLERLLSAYRDKLENSNLGFEHGTKHFYRKYGSKIVRKYRDGASALRPGTYLEPPPGHPRPSGLEPTFEEFVRYLIDTDLLNYSDDHWIPYYLFCTPCLLDYDFIVKVETMSRDQAYVIRRSGLEGRIKPRWRHSTKPDGHRNVSAVYYSQLTRQQVMMLYEKYRLDFELFDYDLKPYLKYASF